MQTVVIIVLLLAGVLCIGAQIAITYLSSRPAKPEAAEPVAPPAPAPAAKTAGARTAAAKAKAEADAAEALAAEAEALKAVAEAESTTARLLRHTTTALGSKTAADAKLGMLGLVLMLVAVALVVDITFAFTVAT